MSILTAYYSKRDKFGNCYWAFRWQDKDKTVQATSSGGESNIAGITRVMGGEVYFHVVEMGIREFNRFTKGWPHAGCTPSELAEFIHNN
jgi:hypothetical protein